MRSVWRSPPDRSAGPRWKAACPVLVDGECIGGVGVSGGDWETDVRIAQGGRRVDRRGMRATQSRRSAKSWQCRAAARRLHRHGLVVGRSGRRHPALGQARDRRLLHPLRGKAQDLRQRNIAAGRPTSYEAILADPGDRGDHQHHAERRASGDHPRGRGRRQARLPRQADRQHASRTAAPSPRPAARPAWCWRSAISGGARAISAGSGSRSTTACSASSSTPRPTSAATGSARSISPRGATRPPACPAA